MGVWALPPSLPLPLPLPLPLSLSLCFFLSPPPPLLLSSSLSLFLSLSRCLSLLPVSFPVYTCMLNIFNYVYSQYSGRVPYRDMHMHLHTCILWISVVHLQTNTILFFKKCFFYVSAFAVYCTCIFCACTLYMPVCLCCTCLYVSACLFVCVPSANLGICLHVSACIFM